MNPYKLKIAQLHALVAIADCGNFSEAAHQLGVSQSTISHGIATLEDQLGVVLLSRGRHGAQLTPVGERVTQKAQRMLQLLEDIANEVERDKGLQGGTVRVAAFRSVATHLLTGVIARLQTRYPGINTIIIELDEIQDLQQALLQGHADISVAELLPGPEFDTIKILEDEYVALLPPTAGLRNAQLTAWEDLAPYPIITSSIKSCSVRITQELNQAPIPLEIAYSIREDSTAISMVRQGLGVALLPRLAAEPIPEGIQVCRLPFPLSRHIGVSMIKDALHIPAVYAFLDALRNTGKFSDPVANGQSQAV